VLAPAVDGAGNLWGADYINHRVVKFDPSGAMSIVGGNGSAGYSGDGGPATEASFMGPFAVAADGNGGVYVGDGARLRRIDPSGVITTVAGTDDYGAQGDGGPASAAQLDVVYALAVDRSGRVYLGGGNRVRRINLDGIITTVAGTGSYEQSGDGPAASTPVIGPSALALDGADDLYIAEFNRVRKVDASGVMRTIAGTGQIGWSGATGPALSTPIGGVSAMAVASDGTVYFGDYTSHRIRKVTGSTVTTLAGGGTEDIGDGGPATDGRLAVPFGVDGDGAGGFYIADYQDHRVRRVSGSGVITTIAGTGVPGFSGDGGSANAAQLDHPSDVARDGAGNVFIVDSSNNRVRRVEPNGRITTIAGDGIPESTGDGGQASAARLQYPSMLATDGSGAVYVSESARVRRIVPDGLISTFAGTGSSGFSGDGGPATGAQLQSAFDIAFDVAGNLFIADGPRVRRVDTNGIISTVAGGGVAVGDGGAATDASIAFAAGLVVDASGTLFVADAYGQKVRRVDPSGLIWTVAGTGQPGYSGDGGPAAAATLSLPVAVALDGADLIIGDAYNSRVRRVAGVAGPAPDVNQAPVWADWHFGDVHAHAAGDDNLKIHPECEGQRLNEAACAQYLVKDVLTRAERSESDWVVFTEHGPWLGFQRQNSVELYDRAQAERGWNLIKGELDRQSRTGIRGLMGQEMGTAAPACTVIDGKAAGNFRSPGHFNVFSTPSFIDNSMMDCNETGANGYAAKPASRGAWGGINHPDNEDGGSRWHCYGSEFDRNGVPHGVESQPQLLRSRTCPLGVDQYAARTPESDATFRTLEVINGGNLPSAKTLGVWDMFLQNDFKIAAVGGGDGHTAPREAKGSDIRDCLLKMFRIISPATLGECVDEGAPEKVANHGKVGASGRTLAGYPSTQQTVTPGSYDSANEEDPARQAIRTGRTVATNGPEVTAQVAGAYPGSSVDVVAGRKVPVRVDWVPTFQTVGDPPRDQRKNQSDVEAFGQPSPPPYDEDEDVPDRIVVVTGSRTRCGTSRVTCAGRVKRTTIDLASAAGRSDVDLHLSEHWAEIMVDVPGPNSYVRVELYHDVRDPNPLNTEKDTDHSKLPRFIDGREYDFAAFTSPVYVHQVSDAHVSGKVVDGATGDPVDGANVEVCRTDGVAVCVSRMSGSDGTFPTVDGPAGTWAARAFPPSGDDRGYAKMSIGALGAGASRSVTLSLPAAADPYIDPAGRVVDDAGTPVTGAAVQLWAGPGPNGPFEPVPAGAAVMSPANRTNPVVTDGTGSFAWDTLTGFYKVTATKDGCVSVDGAPSSTSSSCWTAARPTRRNR
jgi:hypothetical protein